MEPTNHPFRKENDLPKLRDYVAAANLQGCTYETKNHPKIQEISNRTHWTDP